MMKMLRRARHERRARRVASPQRWLARLLLRCYPRLWRARFAEEARDLLATRPPTWADVGDLAGVALYTHLHPDVALTGEESLQERLVVLMRALRSSEFAVFWAFVIAVIAWLQFGGLVDGGPYQTVMGASTSWPLLTLDWRNPLNLTMDIVSAGVDLAFLGVLVGGLPLAMRAWRRTPHVRWLLLTPIVAAITAFLPAPIALLLVGPVAVINLTFNTPVTIGYLIWFVLAAVVSALAVTRAIAASDPEARDARLLRFAFAPGAVVALGLLLTFGGVFAWGIVAHAQAPQLFDRGALMTGYASVTSWAVDVVALALAMLLAIASTLRGLASLGANPPDVSVADHAASPAS